MLQRHLQIPLMDAERAWSKAMEIQKSMEESGIVNKRRHYMVARFAKASKHAAHLAALCSKCCDSRTYIEAEGYAAMMTAQWQKEKENWAIALQEYMKARYIPHLVFVLSVMPDLCRKTSVIHHFSIFSACGLVQSALKCTVFFQIKLCFVHLLMIGFTEERPSQEICVESDLWLFRKLFEELSKVGEFEQQALFSQVLGELDPSIRFCRYELDKKGDKIKVVDDDIMESIQVIVQHWYGSCK